MILKYKQQYLTKNKYSRPGEKNSLGHTRKDTKAIVLHWTGVPQQPASHVFNWFEQRKAGNTGWGSAHYVIDFNGEITQMIPDEELAYHVGSKTYTKYGLSLSDYPNDSTIGVEMCVLNSEGEYAVETWDAAVILTTLLLMKFKLTANDITTHQAIVGWKNCPKWFVDNPKELERFKDEVHQFMIEGIQGIIIQSDVAPNGTQVKVKGIYNGEYLIDVYGSEKFVPVNEISLTVPYHKEDSYVG